MKQFLVFLILSCAVCGLKGQATTNYEPMVVPPPPDVASLGKYGDVPVSLYTGIPSIIHKQQ